ncbi:uncharacterized protein LOC142176224 [Nicotiana tabacum]|uniref:Uncharacterized protein LOC142176224 n=1 Tax=Nicotiana tabacum TaxID=4097 RepID=A0AC58TQF7_TOBAC
MADDADRFFKEQLQEETTTMSFDILEHVPTLVDYAQNVELIKQPTKEEVIHAVFGLNGDSAGGPDGFTGCFFHTCWDIIAEDMVVTFSDMRPISLSNFVNKIFSRVVHERLAVLLPNIVSEEQVGFVKGRSIVENVLLTQEIITDIRLRTKAGPNVVIKLDMAKAYDRLSWLFLTKVFRKMGFGERFIGLVYGIVANNWYSVLLNGQPYGFFKSTRGVKQGDPISPTLFILAAEALSRGLNALHKNLHFCGFGLPKWSPKINHLSYADDIIIFSSSDATSLTLIMKVLAGYEAASGQLINKSKSAIYLHHSAGEEVVDKVQRIIGFNKQEFPFTYLGCPIFYARRRMDYYQDLMTKVLDKLQDWKGIGALYFVTTPDFVCDESIQNIYDVVVNDQWDEVKIREILPEQLANHILLHIKPPVVHDALDKPLWMLESRGEFTVKSSWDYVRIRNQPSNAYRFTWVKGLPFKISFFMWKLWKNKLPLDDFLRKIGYLMASKCWCRSEPHEETMQHLFYSSYAATKVWKYFLGHAGINVDGITLHQAITKCWTVEVIPRLKPTLQALPAVIVWELWKRRNSYKHGEPVTINRVINHISTSMKSLVKFRKPSIQRVPHRWPDLLNKMESYLPKLKYTKVMWDCPSPGWIKVNTDGASRGNPGRSEIGYVLRNEEGDLTYGYGREVQEGTNSEAEAQAILEAMRFCIDNDYILIELHTDSMMLKNVLNRE